MFAHRQRFSQVNKSQPSVVNELLRQKQHADLAEEAAKSQQRYGKIVDDIFDKAFKLFMMDYIFNRGVFSKEKK